MMNKGRLGHVWMRNVVVVWLLWFGEVDFD